jgi:hypothetical protein
VLTAASHSDIANYNTNPRVKLFLDFPKRHFPKRWGKTKVVNARKLLDLIGPDLEQ